MSALVSERRLRKSHPRRLARVRRHVRLRKRLIGTAVRPRMSVFRSNQHLHVQLIDDLAGHTLLGVSTVSLSSKRRHGGNVAAAKELGTLVAEEAKKRGIAKVVFDRGGCLYHGRIQAVAASAREGGLEL